MKHWRYLSYVMRHKWFVFVAGLKTGAPLWRLVIHDWSKFLPSEWFAYVTYFYGKCPMEADEICQRAKRVLGHNPYTTVEQAKVAFDKAWNHHQKANPHHWQYWVLITDSDEPRQRPLAMPTKFVREMVADWAGAGRAISGKWEVRSWYAKNADKMLLHPVTREYVCQLLGKFSLSEFIHQMLNRKPC